MGGRSSWLVPAFLALLIVPPAWVAAGVVIVVAARLAILAARGRRLARREALVRLRSAPGSAPINLGIDGAGRRITLSESQLSAHGLILGASGSGKSTTLIALLSAQIERGRPVVAIDLKGSPNFAAQLAEAALASGRRFQCWSPDGPEAWNPLAHGNATELKDKLIATERFTEPHYQRAAERYIQCALQVLREVHPERPVSLEAVVQMLEPARLAGLARGLPRERASRVGDYLSSLAPDQLSAVRGLAARLAIISESHTGPFLGRDPGAGGEPTGRAPGPGGEPTGRAPGAGGESIDLRASLARDDVVLFSLNSSTYGRLSAQLGTLVVQDLVSAAGHRLSTGQVTPAVVAIDEFSALGSDNVMSLLARGREAGVSVLLATQELADLERAARGLRDQVLGNTAVKIAHRQDVPSSAETVARLAGTARHWERSYGIQPGRWGGSDLRRGTLRLVDRFLVDPNQVRTLRTGEAVVIVKTPESSARVARVLPAGRVEPAGRVAPGERALPMRSSWTREGPGLDR